MKHLPIDLPTRVARAPAPHRSTRQATSRPARAFLLAVGFFLFTLFIAIAPMKARAQGNDLHVPFGALLSRYVAVDDTGLARVDYGAWKANAGDVAALATYLDALSAAKPSSMDEASRMAFYINAYNALTLKVVLDHYPVASIREISISPGLFSIGPWKKKLLSIEGEMLSLDDIEHTRLLAAFRDNRIHYAVNCASVGCPNLAAEPYRGNTLSAQLDEAARAYVNNARGVDLSSGRLKVSRIYEWYQGDFGGSEEGVIAHLKLFAAPELRAKLDGVSSIRSTFYDWSLNDAKDE